MKDSATLDRFAMPRRVFHDERTGREVWQVTDGDFECVAPYMEKPAWTPDERFLFFMCNRDGTWQPYRLHLATGEAQQLCRARNAMYRSLVYEPNRDEVYVEDAGTFVAVQPESLESRVAVDYGAYFGRAGGHKGNAATLSGDGTLAAFSWRNEEGRPTLLIARTDGSNAFRRVRVGDPRIAPGHLQFNPTDNDLLSCCNDVDRQNDPNEEPFLRAREYRMDLRTGEVRPLVLMPPGRRATHCVWGASGERMYAHRKHVPDWVPTALVSVDKEGGDLRVYFETSEHRLGHSQPSPDERWIVTDSQDPDENILMLVSTERDEQHLLCWPNTSINSGRPDKRRPELPPHTDRHTHPGFSPTGRYVHYTSDVSGRSQVYVVPVGDLL